MTLDPGDWSSLRRLGHRMVDDMFDHLEQVRERPVWQPIPAEIRAALRTPMPRAPGSAEAAYAAFTRLVLPYPTGNTHPRFMGWVHGGGNAVGMLAELLAAGLNANLGGRDHAPIEVERQVIRWTAELLGLPLEASGLLVTGTSIANLIGLLVARTAALGTEARAAGLGGVRLTAYTSEKAHGCIARAMDMAGLGTDALRLIPCDAEHRMDVCALEAAIARDRAGGATPFLLVGTAGTVDIGAFDDLLELGRIARAEGLWFHVDGAFGAMAALSPELREKLAGVEQADSLACDFHKWLQVPYDAGCILVRDPARHLAAFAQQVAYLRREARGLAAGHPWPCDLGPDLSRGFRALKVWMTWQVYGSDRLGEVVAQTCAVARALADRVDREPALQRLAPVPLNIVCFHVRDASDDFNRDIVADLQEAAVAAPSTTMIDGRLAIRAAIVNHRTRIDDAEALVDAVLAAADRRSRHAC
jgi:glutamate/tyrosine decarboxylase-like PLP-dependent enzyme